MSAAWPRVPLDEIFAIARGGSPRPIDNYVTDDPNGVNWVMISDATESGKYINFTKKRIREDGAKRSRYVRPGDFLLTNSMSFGRPYIMNTTGCIHDGWLVLSPRNGNASADFFYHLLSSDLVYSEFERVAAGATVKNLNIELVKRVKVPLPPLPEQRRIAEVLDRAEALRAKRRAALAHLDTLTQSIFLDLLKQNEGSLRQIPIEDAMDTIIDYRGKSPTKTAEGVPLITARVIKDRQLLEPTEFIAEKDYELWMRRGMPRSGDVLFTTEAPLGEVAQLDGQKVALAQRLLVLRGKSALLNNTFLMYALTSQDVKRQIDSRATGSTVRGIRQSELRRVRIPVPPLVSQNQFNRRIAAVETLRRTKHASLTRLNDLFATLQYRAFRGEL